MENDVAIGRGSFERIYRENHDPIYTYVLSRMGDPVVAQDLTSETFCRAYQAIDSYVDQGKPVRALLFTIARNLTLDHQRSRCYDTARVAAAAALCNTSARADSTEDQVVWGDVSEKLQGAILNLSRTQGRCLFLRFFLGMSVADTARVLGRKEPAARAIQYRAVNRLAGMLAEDVEHGDLRCSPSERG